jgi:hypothetical protein
VTAIGSPRRAALRIAGEFADLVKSAAQNWVNDYAQSMGAALAFLSTPCSRSRRCC